MILYLDVKTNIKDVFVDFIEVKLNNGKVVSLSWDESYIDRDDNGFSTKYKGVYFDDEYANGKLDLLKGAAIEHVELYYEKDYENPYFVINSMEFEDNERLLNMEVNYSVIAEEKNNVEKAIEFCRELIEKYDANEEIDDLDICHIIEILKGRE
jgi:hypothetical protein